MGEMPIPSNLVLETPMMNINSSNMNLRNSEDLLVTSDIRKQLGLKVGNDGEMVVAISKFNKDQRTEEKKKSSHPRKRKGVKAV